MKKNMKKMLSWLLVFMMVFSLVPVSALAADPDGSEDYPYDLVLGTNTATLTKVDDYEYYAYTATEAGVLTFTMSSDNDSWFYSGYVNNSDNYDQFINENKSYTTTDNSSTDTNATATRAIELAAGDKMVLRVSTARNSDWERPAGTVTFTASFEAGASAGGGSDELEEYAIDYDNQLELGQNSVVLFEGYVTTIFEFEPEETGEYVITTSAGVVGYWGGGSFFVQAPTGELTNTFTKQVDAVGQSIMVGVSGTETAIITITRSGEADDRQLPRETYEAIFTPGKFSFGDMNYEDLEFVDVTAEEMPVAVMDLDGIYHLGSVDGPVLFLNMDDEYISLMMASYGYGRLMGCKYNENGEVIATVDYNPVFDTYYMQSSAGFYPLNEDLKTILVEVGNNEQWYSENSWAGASHEFAWLFLCYYSEDVTSITAPFEVPEGFNTVTGENSAGIIDELPEGTEEFEIEMTNGGNVSKDVLEAAKDNNVDLVLDFGEYIWNIIAEEIGENAVAVDLEVTFENEIPADKIEDVLAEEDDSTILLSIAHEGEFGFTATLTINAGTENNGRYANLYYYNNGELNLMGNAKINADGSVEFEFNHASEYVVVVSDEAHVVGSPLTGEANILVYYGMFILAAAGLLVLRRKVR